MFMASCQNNNPVTPPPEIKPPVGAKSIAVVMAAADYSSANFEIISANDYTTVSANLINGLHTDLAVRAFGADVYILERFLKDNIIKYSTANMAPAYQENLGIGLNIQDFAIASESKAYISSHEDSDLIIFNPSAGKRVSTIDLSRFAAYAGTDSAEAQPFIGQLALHGNYLYAACQRLKIEQGPWGPAPAPGDTSLILVIDTETDAVVREIRLNKKNPVAMSIHGDRMLVASPGDWFDPATGGIEVIDLASNQNLGVKVEGITLNVIFVSANRAYMAEMSADWTTGIIPFDPSTGTKGSKITGIEDGSGGMAHDGEKLYAGDRGFGSAGVAVINTSTDAIEQKIPTSMPPAGLAIISAD